MTLADTGFAALDLVFADDLRSLDRELRARLAGVGRCSLAMQRDPAWPAGARSIVEAATLAATLRAMAAGATPLSPAWLVAPGATPQHQPDREELLGRCEALLTALQQALSAGTEVVGRIDARQRGRSPRPTWTPSTLRSRRSAAFGVGLEPDPTLRTNATWARGAWEAAAARWTTASAQLAELRAPGAASWTDAQVLLAVTSIAEGVLGDGFRMLPLLRHQPVDVGGQPQPNDFATALTQPAFDAPKASQLSAFVRDHATVRAGMGRLAEAQLIGRALGRTVALRVVQLGARDADGRPEPGTQRWLGGPLADDQPWPARPVAHVVAELVGAAGRLGRRRRRTHVRQLDRERCRSAPTRVRSRTMHPPIRCAPTAPPRPWRCRPARPRRAHPRSSSRPSRPTVSAGPRTA